MSNTDAAGTVYMPSIWGIFLTLRRVAIGRAINDGAAQRDIAKRFGITERSVRSLRTTKSALGKRSA